MFHFSFVKTHYRIIKYHPPGKMIFILLLSILASDSNPIQCRFIDDKPTSRCDTGFACNSNYKCVTASSSLKEPDCIREFIAKGTCKKFLCDHSGKKNCESGYFCQMFGKHGICVPDGNLDKPPK
eukprot:NODE_466_length_7077_cov_0.565205.p6 type:complete len:125 gc:universal NODE_466_length_7077_cov_0.565205:6271-5897(-)